MRMRDAVSAEANYTSQEDQDLQASAIFMYY
jgi:hypothetical protein